MTTMLGDCVSRLRISQGTNGRLKSNVQYGLNSSTLGELWRRHRAGRLKSLSADVIRLTGSTNDSSRSHACNPDAARWRRRAVHGPHQQGSGLEGGA